MRAHDHRIAGFYAIADLEPMASVSAAIQLAEALLAGAGVLQLRMKLAATELFFACARAVQQRCAAAGVPLIINDRLDIALAVGAAGVQLGQEDLPATVARRLAPTLLVGISTHTLTQARAAVAAGADYIGFGPVFPTTSKLRPDPEVGLAGLGEAVRAVDVPVVAIGGITPERAPAVMAAGAAAVAAIECVVRARDVRAAATTMAGACRAQSAYR
jgi:thiamine-phosphate pyrophosphorylase